VKEDLEKKNADIEAATDGTDTRQTKWRQFVQPHRQSADGQEQRIRKMSKSVNKRVHIRVRLDLDDSRIISNV